MVEEPLISREFFVCLGLSILLHLASFMLFAKGGMLSISQRQNYRYNVTQHKVNLLATPELNKAVLNPEVPAHNQIVQPAQKPNLLKPQDTHLSSDTDNSVLHEQLKRGQQAKVTQSVMLQESVPAAGGGIDAKATTSGETRTDSEVGVRRRAVAKAELERAVEKVSSSQKTSAQSFSSKIVRQEAKSVSKHITSQKTNVAASSKAVPKDSALFLDNSEVAGITGSGARIQGRGRTEVAKQDSQDVANLGRGLTEGSNDFLPQVRDGELTMLNTKANLFAPFVRRVAEKVFNELRSRHWSSVGRVDLTKAVRPVMIEAILDETGALLSVSLTSSSGSVQFDNALESAVNVGAWDKNPPKGALTAERQIHFIFQSQVWSRRVSNRGDDSRWILLGTGLK